MAVCIKSLFALVMGFGISTSGLSMIFESHNQISQAYRMQLHAFFVMLVIYMLQFSYPGIAWGVTMLHYAKICF